MIELNKIYNEDCLEGMKRIPDGSVDMILCDLPYGTTRNKWDSVIDLDLLWEQYNRIIKDNGAIVLTAQTPFDKVLGVSNLKMLKYEWIWEKSKATGFLNAKRMPLKAHENILVFYKKLPTYNPQMMQGKLHSRGGTGRQSKNYGSYADTKRIISNTYFPRDVLKVNWQDSMKGLHPTQKPVSLCEYFIKTYSNKGDIILDPFIGSGTTAVAAINTERKYIGFEKDDKYFDIAQNRLDKLTNI